MFVHQASESTVLALDAKLRTIVKININTANMQKMRKKTICAYLYGQLEQLQLLVARWTQVHWLTSILRYGMHYDLLTVSALYHLTSLNDLHLIVGRRDCLDDGHVSVWANLLVHDRWVPLKTVQSLSGSY